MSLFLGECGAIEILDFVTWEDENFGYSLGGPAWYTVCRPIGGCPRDSEHRTQNSIPKMMYREHVVTIHGRGNSARGIHVLDLAEVFLIARWRQALLGKLPQASCGGASRFHRSLKAWRVPFRLFQQVVGLDVATQNLWPAETRSRSRVCFLGINLSMP